jgi:hypothetical protein
MNALFILGSGSGFELPHYHVQVPQGQIFNGLADTAFLVLMCNLFSGSFNALIVGAGASLIMSVYLELFPLRNPVKTFASRVRGLFDINRYRRRKLVIIDV